MGPVCTLLQFGRPLNQNKIQMGCDYNKTNKQLVAIPLVLYYTGLTLQLDETQYSLAKGLSKMCQWPIAGRQQVQVTPSKALAHRQALGVQVLIILAFPSLLQAYSHCDHPQVSQYRSSHRHTSSRHRSIRGLCLPVHGAL
jgi:hypothetical protein